MASVTFKCDESEALEEVEETEVCVYALIVRTPLACMSYMESKALRQLEDLKVFGFNRNHQREG